MDSPTDVTAAPSSTTEVSSCSHRDGTVPTPDAPPTGPCV